MPVSPHGFVPSSAEDILRRRVKAELRTRMRALRGALPESACAEKSSRIVEHLAALDPIGRARSVALFWPMIDRHEVDLRSLDARLRARAVRVAYPRLEESGAMTFRFVPSVDSMQPHPLGMLEPTEEAPPAAAGELDVIVAPALAVDPRGHRIGYGEGHYDRALEPLASSSVAIVVAFDFQLVAETPDTEGDVAAAWIVTDRRVLASTPGTAGDPRPNG
jgi:5-formyltetrahydrofolate cyclo-ligase